MLLISSVLSHPITGCDGLSFLFRLKWSLNLVFANNGYGAINDYGDRFPAISRCVFVDSGIDRS